MCSHGHTICYCCPKVPKSAYHELYLGGNSSKQHAHEGTLVDTSEVLGLNCGSCVRVLIKMVVLECAMGLAW